MPRRIGMSEEINYLRGSTMQMTCWLRWRERRRKGGEKSGERVERKVEEGWREKWKKGGEKSGRRMEIIVEEWWREKWKKNGEKNGGRVERNVEGAKVERKMDEGRKRRGGGWKEFLKLRSVSRNKI